MRKEPTWKALIPLCKSPRVLFYPFYEDAAKPQLSVNQGKLNCWCSGLGLFNFQNCKQWISVVCYLVLCQLDTSYSHFGREILNWETTTTILPYEQDCGTFSWSMVDVGVHSLLCALSPLSFWSWVLWESWLSQPWRASQSAALFHNFYFSFCLWPSCPDFL